MSSYKSLKKLKASLHVPLLEPATCVAALSLAANASPRRRIFSHGTTVPVCLGMWRRDPNEATIQPRHP